MNKWIEGRQGSGYYVWTIWQSKRLKRDCHVIKYDVDSSIPPHRDEVEKGYVHNRVNIVWKSRNVKGGDYLELDVQDRTAEWVTPAPNFRIPLGPLGSIEVYRIQPSEVIHQVTNMESGKRRVLSFGWLSKDGWL